VLEAIERVCRELGTSVVVITHNAAIAAMADRVVALHDGRISDERRNAERRAPAGAQRPVPAPGTAPGWARG